MKRLSAPGLVLPLLLAVVGVSLIVVGQLQLDGSPSGSLPGIPEPTSPAAVASRGPSVEPSVGVSLAPTASPTSIPDSWVAVQIEIASVNLNVAVKHATAAQSGFPPEDGAYVLYESSEPGRGTNSYIIGHAQQLLFKRLWNVQLGAEVKVLMSDSAVLRYVVTEIRPNISCPDSRAPKPPHPPLALIHAPPGCVGAVWTQPTDHERLTLQTSQGYNRNWGELIVVAKPVV